MCWGAGGKGTPGQVWGEVGVGVWESWGVKKGGPGGAGGWHRVEDWDEQLRGSPRGSQHGGVILAQGSGRGGDVRVFGGGAERGCGGFLGGPQGFG